MDLNPYVYRFAGKLFDATMIITNRLLDMADYGDITVEHIHETAGVGRLVDRMGNRWLEYPLDEDWLKPMVERALSCLMTHVERAKSGNRLVYWKVNPIAPQLFPILISDYPLSFGVENNRLLVSSPWGDSDFPIDSSVSQYIVVDIDSHSYHLMSWDELNDFIMDASN